jgi:alpha-glucosidase
VYYGEEIGMRDVEIPVDEQFDTGVVFGSRDPARTPMQWNSSSNAGFSSVSPWLRMALDFKNRNVELQESEPNSILNFYRQLSNIRSNSLALLLGNWRPLIRKPDKAMVFLREHHGKYALVALNFTNKKIRVRLDESLPVSQWHLSLSTCRPSDGNEERLEKSFDLAPYEASIFGA